jgi:hypothetical protein
MADFFTDFLSSPPAASAAPVTASNPAPASTGGGFFSGLTSLFSTGASAYANQTNSDLQTALGKQNAKTAAAAAATAQTNQSSTLKLVLIIGGAVLGLATVFGLIVALKK